MTDRQQHIIKIEWDTTARPGLPRFIGPFGTTSEADDWGRINISNGTWWVIPIAPPYATREQPAPPPRHDPLPNPVIPTT